MLRLPVRLAFPLLCLVLSSTAAAQQPSPADAARILQSRPDLAAQVRDRLEKSGLTPDQVRARLQAEGYPSTLLDAYMSSQAGDSVAAPGADVLSAMRALGIEEDLPPRGRGGRDTLAVRRDSVDRRALPRDALVERANALRDSGFVIFGLDVFSRGGTEFDPNLAGPVDANYRLGPGDRLVLILTGDVEAAYTLDVTREGFVVIPQVGQIPVANLTLGQLEDLLYSRLGRVYSGVTRGAGATTRFSISVARLRSNQVYVVGDVTRPGSYRVSSAGTLMSALYAAGGPTVNGSFRRVELRRGGRLIGTFDLYNYLLLGSSSGDLRLETGDVVFVPPHGGRTRVAGEVIRPATYELREGETLRDVIAFAGGFTAGAERRRVQVERIIPAVQRSAAMGGSDRMLIEVASSELASGTGPAIPMQAGDVVRVFPLADRVTNQVAVEGNVWSPGTVAFRAGMRLSDALRLAGGVRPDSYLGQVLVTRLLPDSSRVQLRTALRDTLGNAVNDLALADGDRVQVFSQAEFRPKRYVVISGAVKNGGRYEYREGMTIRDLVLLAGGLEESALLTEAEVARMPENRAEGVTARAVRVPLDSSYLFERGPDGRYLGPPGIPAPRGPTPDVTLEPYDNVLIFRQPDWSLPRTVVLSGEVVRPGRYTLERKGERLGDLIERAGGLTREAYAAGIGFFRPERGVGRIGVDLPAVLRDSRNRENLILVDGDSIHVPIFSSVVNVRGAVNFPVAVPYVPGRDLDYYIGSAGGPTQMADAGHAFVTQPNGKVESKRGRGPLPAAIPRPQPGASVFVPEKRAEAKRDIAATVALATQVIASLAALVAIVR